MLDQLLELVRGFEVQPVALLDIALTALLIYGLLSAWTYGRTGHPAVGALANAIALAWALGVTFPLLAA